MLKNFDQIANLQDSGKFTQANLVKTCFPEIPKPGEDPMAELKALFGQWEDCTAEDPLEEPPHRYPRDLSTPLQDTMEATGCSIEDAYEIVMGRKQLPTLQYYSSGTLSLASFGGSLDEARNQLAGDLHRADGYFYNADGKQLLGDKDGVFRFNLPGGKCLVATKSGQVNDSGKAVVAGLEELCGKVHPRQTSSLLMMTSQSGLGPLRGALSAYGINSNEHSAVDFTITKDDKTGDITVLYTSPEALPFAFQWSATIKPDGYVTTTPLVFLDERKLSACKAGANEAIANMQKPSGDMAPDFKRNMAAGMALIEQMMRFSGGDQDVIDLLKNEKVCGRIILNAAGKPRPVEAVRKRVEELMDNVAELREATKGNPLMFRMGLSRLSSFAGKALPKGVLSTLVKAVNAADIGKLKKLSAATAKTPDKLHQAVAQYHAILTNVVEKSDIINKFDEVGGEEMLSIEMMIGGLLAGRCGESTLRAMKGALESQVAGQLNVVYDDLVLGRFDRSLMSHAEGNVLMKTAGELLHNLSSMLYDACEALGEPEQAIKPFKGDIRTLDGLPAIFTDVRDIVRTLHAGLIETESRGLVD